MIRDRIRNRQLAPAVLASLAAHVGAVASVGWIAFALSQRTPRAAASMTAPPSDVIAIDLAEMADGTELADRDVIPEGVSPTAHGGATIARMDTGVAGRGGQAAGPRAVNLADTDDHMRLSPDLTSRLDRDQIQRLHTAQLRTTREDRRSTTRPMELTFLATGTGEHQERRPNAARDPSRGSLVAPSAAVLGGRPGGPDGDIDDGLARTPGSRAPGQLVASPGLGIRDGREGSDHRAAARIALGRPSVTEAPPTIPAALRGRPNDTVDSDQEVASLVSAQVHASFAGGLVGAGQGAPPALLTQALARSEGTDRWLDRSAPEMATCSTGTRTTRCSCLTFARSTRSWGRSSPTHFRAPPPSS
ncbi:hypothetical protein AKJ09_07926 [Labilithrix luteola]|uniref:Uncharacterized protein n=1 Tax=Labilithrix luteola TaxID=1391654 RepID=A0A0K1Q6B1_9BACT|nr:hypothetical protein [Labilithrix luteola]AKV01263.1 hypothetical protein AKJ09_07926 [Labilithrix luteola]